MPLVPGSDEPLVPVALSEVGPAGPIVQDQDGNDVDVGHHAWVEGPCLTCIPADIALPMTVSASHGCGRMMFSTYHTTESAHLGLTPQELILLYVILEIGVCHDGG